MNKFEYKWRNVDKDNFPTFEELSKEYKPSKYTGCIHIDAIVKFKKDSNEKYNFHTTLIFKSDDTVTTQCLNSNNELKDFVCYYLIPRYKEF